MLLSGGIGAGKSTVGALLAARGADVISADRLGHALLEPGSDVHEQVADRWPQVVGDDDRIDRGALAGIVFGDPGELAALEDMTHPAIRAAARAAAESSSAEVVVVEVPLPGEFLGPGWVRVVVHADAAVRRQRLRAAGWSETDISGRMAAQPTDDEWRDQADYVLDNGGDEATLRPAVDRLWEWICTGSDLDRERSRPTPHVE